MWSLETIQRMNREAVEAYNNRAVDEAEAAEYAAAKGCSLCWHDFAIDHPTDHAHEEGSREDLAELVAEAAGRKVEDLGVLTTDECHDVRGPLAPHRHLI